MSVRPGVPLAPEEGETIEHMSRAASATEPFLNGVWPVGLSRVQAAFRVGVSPALFDRAVKDGKMPKPFRLYGRVLWRIHKIDEAIAALDSPAAGDDGWDDVAP